MSHILLSTPTSSLLSQSSSPVSIYREKGGLYLIRIRLQQLRQLRLLKHIRVKLRHQLRERQTPFNQLRLRQLRLRNLRLQQYNTSSYYYNSDESDDDNSDNNNSSESENSESDSKCQVEYENSDSDSDSESNSDDTDKFSMFKKTSSVCNVKVASIRPTYHNLKEWMDDTANNVYIGRAGPVFIDGVRFPKQKSVWANPFKREKDENRDEVLIKYDKYIQKKIIDEHLDIESLRHKNLGCWCVQKSCFDFNEPLVCHGQILLRLLHSTKK